MSSSIDLIVYLNIAIKHLHHKFHGSNSVIRSTGYFLLGMVFVNYCLEAEVPLGEAPEVQLGEA